jgi:hypothetical protein
MGDRENHQWRGEGAERATQRGRENPESLNPDFAESEDFELDLSAIQADDALLDALGGADFDASADLGDRELSALLLAWRQDIDSEPLAELVDTKTATEVLRTTSLEQYRAKKANRRRLVAPIAAAAVVLAVVFTGSSLAARDAQPGDTLWALTKVLYSEHARSIEAAATARDELQVADTALVQGRLSEARKALDDAGTALQKVSSGDGLDHLTQQHELLTEKLQSPSTPQDPTSGTPSSGPSDGSSSSAPEDSTKPTDPTGSTSPTSPSSPPSTDPTGTGSSTAPSSPPSTSGGTGTTPRDDSSTITSPGQSVP